MQEDAQRPSLDLNRAFRRTIVPTALGGAWCLFTWHPTLHTATEELTQGGRRVALLTRGSVCGEGKLR